MGTYFTLKHCAPHAAVVVGFGWPENSGGVLSSHVILNKSELGCVFLIHEQSITINKGDGGYTRWETSDIDATEN